MTIERAGASVFDGTARVADMTREPAKLATVLHSSYTLPVGAWLLTGTSLVPPEPYTANPGDVVRIAIDGLGELTNRVSLVKHSGGKRNRKDCGSASVTGGAGHNALST